MAMRTLMTVWGENVNDNPLQEYPRPQFRRKSYINLNGWWQYAISRKDTEPVKYDGKIRVPFSPESVLSGVNRQLKPKEYLWYNRQFTIPANFNKGIVLLHFGAVDSICDIYVNGNFVRHHEGGYNAFSADITHYLSDNGKNTLLLRVQDFSDTKYYTNGKQALRRKGMWYTAQSGIWQTVWLESVPTQYIKGIKITPNFDQASVTIEADCNFDEPITAIVSNEDGEVAKGDGRKLVTVHFPNGKFKAWSPEDPYLYDLKIISRRDTVDSYFGMRKFACEKVGEHWRIMLNNQPYFHNGILDQGYWSDGLYTAPDDQAMIYDIQTMKDLGFNMLRKHVKVEPMRWYYHCDRLGMLVWQDMPSGGTSQNKLFTLYLPFMGMDKMEDGKYEKFSRKTQISRDTYMREYNEMVNQLYNCTCISTWVPFNEGWGQFDANKVAQRTKLHDPTRLVDHASGWHDQGGGDFQSLHVYYKKVNFKNDGKRVTALTEFGGYSYKDSEHSFNPDSTYTYKAFNDIASFNSGVRHLFERDVVDKIDKGLSATVYTQVSDVEDEVNGLFTYDRKVLKIDPDLMRDINAKIKL